MPLLAAPNLPVCATKSVELTNEIHSNMSTIGAIKNTFMAILK